MNIAQQGDHFNFDDIIKRFSDTTNAEPKKDAEPVRYFIENCTIEKGIVNYNNFAPPASVSIIDLNVSVKPIAYTDSVYYIS
ncbi:hypothetical protein NL529_30845, partial [Klebsiella pneumoniae]|nr:hypothetical protein [Klebsiella pneumoniae]